MQNEKKYSLGISKSCREKRKPKKYNQSKESYYMRKNTEIFNQAKVEVSHKTINPQVPSRPLMIQLAEGRYIKLKVKIKETAHEDRLNK